MQLKDAWHGWACSAICRYNLRSTQGNFVQNLCAFKAGSVSRQGARLACKVALSAGDSLVVDD